MARVRGVTGERAIALEAWEVARCEPGAIASPSEAGARGLAWVAARAPGTVASALRAAKQWDVTSPARFDASDWWFRAKVKGAPASQGEAIALRLGGLATIAEVWWNGESILKSDNMFTSHDVDVTARVRDENDVAIRFASLDAALASKRGRPRWRARMVEKTQLRFARTSLLGRMPSWSGSGAAVGPWRAIALAHRARATVLSCDARAACDGKHGTEGVVTVTLRVRAHGAAPTSATLVVGSLEAKLALRHEGDALVVEGAARMPDVARWWPHTHGAQPRHDARVVLTDARAGDPIAIDLGPLAFRELRVRDDDGDFALSINGAPLFARGACWMPLDPASLANDPAALERALDLAVRGGMNAIRVPGVCPYEDDAFYDACDRRGLLVWQDLALASMDYPWDDAAFAASVEREVRELLDRTQTCASLAVVCGGSETEQQPAMLGLPREAWSHPFVRERLASIVRESRPDVAYVSSSPTGGTMPFDANRGVSHYYGVGAYARPIDDARRADVRFTSECLAFANVPGDDAIDRALPEGARPTTHPAWKAGVPRDSSTGWDFDDVRDHYLGHFFGVDPAKLRYADVDRYLALSRVASGAAMEGAVAEWRRVGSRCRGAIVWTMRDLRPGAGWGLVTSDGEPKAAWWFARRAFAPVALFAIDEGVNGLALHAANDRDAPIDGELRVALFRDEAKVDEGRAKLVVPARGAATLPMQALVDRFVDATYAYRFGPPGHDVIAAHLVDAGGAIVARAFHLPLGLARPRVPDVGLEATAARAGDGCVAVTLKTRAFAQSIAIDAPGWEPDDAFFHLEPSGERVVAFRALSAPPPAFRAAFAPLNAHAVARVTSSP